MNTIDTNLSIERDHKEYAVGGWIIIHDHYIAYLSSQKTSMFGREGHWVIWSGSHKDGSFYEMAQIGTCPKIMPHIDNKPIGSDYGKAKKLLKFLRKNHVTIDKDNLQPKLSISIEED
jgi:hypothetical protein